MAPSNDMLNTHVVRLRFFRLLVVAALLLLGICALQLPFGDSQDSQPTDSVVAASAEKDPVGEGGPARKRPKAATTQHIQDEPSGAGESPSADPPQGEDSDTGKKDKKIEAFLHHIGQPDEGTDQPPSTPPTAVEPPGGVTVHLPQDNPVLEVVAKGLVFQVASNAGRRVSETTQRNSGLFDKASDLLLRYVPRGTARDPDTSPEPKPAPTIEPPQRQPPAVVPAPQPARLVLLNPAETGVKIHFVVDGEAHTLASGDTYELRDERDAWLIRFHRGGELGEDARYYLSKGTFLFGASQDGWVLVKADVPEEPRD